MRAPGLVQHLLHCTLGVRGEEIGFITPQADGGIEVEIALARADRIETPCTLTLRSKGRESLWTLRRALDPPETGWSTLQLTWEGDTTPSPSAVVRALHDTIEGLLGGESVGAAYVGPGEIQIEVPRAACVSLPPEFIVDGQRIQVSPRDAGMA